MRYHRLTREERYQIAALVKSGLGSNAIARTLGRDKSTVSRELRRNSELSTYKPASAHIQAAARRRAIHPPAKVVGLAREKIINLLERQWSPEQISAWLRRRENVSVSAETIYKFIYCDFKTGGKIYRNLRRRRKWRRSRKAGKGLKRCGRRLSYPPISTRPKVVDQRKRYGDFERDTVLGQARGPVLLCIVDRKSRYTRITKVQKIDARLTHQATVRLLGKQRAHTITNDNGPEFADYKLTAELLNARVFFNDPYSSWQRGTNENTNGLIRQYFPKGTDFTKVSDQEIQKVEDLLNNRPRKTLGYRTPSEVENRKKSGVALRART